MARKILLADDSVTAQNMGRRILSEAGYDVITVNNGSAAIKKIAEHKPDLVILDVYMPGYGGLEVCQRLKEAAETLSIPVLLTVGKLEPFKLDEAHRVHADAHLVKPFEATELLSALTKLEEKIVPQADSRAGKSPVTFTRAEPGRKKDFGDSTTGWKNRLTIPASTPKAEEAEAEPEAAAPTAPAAIAFRNFNHPAEAAQELPPADAPGAAESIYNGMMQDITAEEIAAIAAAAEAFGEKPDGAEADPASGAVSAARAEEIPAGIEPAAEDLKYEPAQPRSHEPEAYGSYASLIEHAQKRASHPSAPDADVAAALESLAPMPDSQPVSAAETKWVAQEIPLSEGEGSFILDREMQKVFAALAAVEADRVAEESASGESALDGALASSPAAGEGAAAEVQGSAEPRPEEQITAEVAHAEIESVQASVEETPAVAAGSEEGAAEQPIGEPPQVEPAAISEPVVESAVAASESLAEPVEENAAPSDGRWSEDHPRADAEAIAERSVEAAAGESQPEEQAVPQPVAEEARGEGVEQAISAEASGAEQASPEPAGVEAISAERVSAETASSEGASDASPAVSGESHLEHEAEAAYAAAASAGAGFGSINAIGSTEITSSIEVAAEPEATTASGAPTASAAGTATPEREAELAAAWAQWRQIRESIGKPAAVTPEEATAAPPSNGAHAADLEPAQAVAPSGGASDPTAIASIVETMLAELRPRLVEEIAKKLGKEAK